jgi:hypothetical protein
MWRKSWAADKRKRGKNVSALKRAAGNTGNSQLATVRKGSGLIPGLSRRKRFIKNAQTCGTPAQPCWEGEEMIKFA